jgi:outer membrane protein assembly factor BamB
VAISDQVDDRLGVVVLSRADGRQVCRRSVFDAGDGSTASDLAALGSGVVVTNNDGYASPRSTLLGFTSQPGVARVDVVDGACVLAWTSDAVSPASGAAASHANGLLYAWTKRPSLAGVSAWYLTAIDADTGRTRWGVRTGTGLLAGSDGSRIMLDRDGAAWVGTLAGLVRVRDRR